MYNIFLCIFAFLWQVISCKFSGLMCLSGLEWVWHCTYNSENSITGFKSTKICNSKWRSLVWLIWYFSTCQTKQQCYKPATLSWLMNMDEIHIVVSSPYCSQQVLLPFLHERLSVERSFLLQVIIIHFWTDGINVPWYWAVQSHKYLKCAIQQAGFFFCYLEKQMRLSCKQKTKPARSCFFFLFFFQSQA